MTYYDDDDAAYDAWQDEQAWADEQVNDSASPIDFPCIECGGTEIDTDGVCIPCTDGVWAAPRPKRATQILEEPF